MVARHIVFLAEKNRRLEFELGAWFEGACGFAYVLALSKMTEHRLGPFGRADLHPRRNPLDRQGRFAPQPGSDGQLAGVAAPASGQLGLRPAPARKLLRDDAVGPLLGGLPVEFPGVALAKLTLHQLQHLLFERKLYGWCLPESALEARDSGKCLIY